MSTELLYDQMQTWLEKITTNNAEPHEVTVIKSDTINTESVVRLIEILDQEYPLTREIILK